MEDNSVDDKIRGKGIKDLFEQISPYWNLIIVCTTIGGFGFWIGSLITKNEYLQKLNEKSLEHQKDIQKIENELIKCQIEVKFFESKSSIYNEKK